ncbi:HypC/HybG/HupF family hydrogenase formation chaperone [Vibrio spartinae]|uniref:Hydrogenase isoenzymes formation protein HypC n=1 Tax=Vibrio spartinae TaxID=1918945 RepID=A0A1N6M0G5_9VIBR|nr:HypC/HybG/HupF family hydrogenase formation chaperone [Vibrio spartinae]QMV15636.1 Hydrogenase isoenzymes formation protein HypC [Vibrio spartinae]SIO92881.1 Hydrogenase isoenzymes formation protein HypC [Vibrio spartinae]
MCLCIPASVVSVDQEQMTAVVDTLGVAREVSTHLISEPIQVGEHLLIHVGFAISKIDQQEAKESLQTYHELISQVGSDDMWLG